MHFYCFLNPISPKLLPYYQTASTQETWCATWYRLHSNMDKKSSQHAKSHSIQKMYSQYIIKEWNTHSADELRSVSAKLSLLLLLLLMLLNDILSAAKIVRSWRSSTLRRDTTGSSMSTKSPSSISLSPILNVTAPLLKVRFSWRLKRHKHCH